MLRAKSSEADVLRRAFELADSGQFGNVAAVAVALRQEGFHTAGQSLSGDYIRAQLVRAIEKALKPLR
jgi:hypothetical protein